MSATLFGEFERAAAAASDKPFLITKNGIVTYGDMLSRTARVAGLLDDLGIKPGDRVVVQAEKSPAAVMLYLGCLRAGAIYVPLNTAYTPAEVAHFLTDAEPALFVCEAGVGARLREMDDQAFDCAVLTLEGDGSGTLAEGMAGARPCEATAARGEDDIAAILYTSGTTGRSKGAMLTHGNLLSNLRSLDQIWRWRADDVLLHALPIYHVHGLFVALHCAMYRASSLIFHEKFDIERIVGDLPRATVFMGVPTYYTRLLADPRLDRDLVAGVRLFVSGSAPLTEPVFEAFEARTGHRILERYGMTEALMITSNPYEGERLAGTVGYPLPGVRVRVAAADGAALAPGEPGVLEIAGPNLFKGYWRMPQKTAAEFRPDGWFVTGDVARIEPDGRVRLVGRAKDLVICGGLNVYPKEIEQLIDLMPGVEEAAVIGAPHPDFGEAVVAVVAARRGADPRPEDIVAGLRGQLAGFKLPKRVFVVDALPRNAMGKVQKAALRERYKDVFGGA